MFDDSPQDSRHNDDEGQSPLVLLSFYAGLLRKYYWVILLTSILSVTAGYFWTKQQPFLYKTETKIIFNNKTNALGSKIERVDMLNGGSVWQFEQFWNTQKEVLASRRFAERVVKSTGLLNDDTYIAVNDSAGKPLSDDTRMRMAVGLVRGTVTYDLQRDSRVVLLTATATSPKLAKLIADGFASAYVDYTKELQTGGLTKLVTWFDSYVGNMRKDLEDSQTALNQYKRDKDILSVSFEDRQNLTAANMESVNSSLNDVLNELAKEQALSDQLDAMKRSGASDSEAARLAGSEALVSLLSRRRELQQQLAKDLTVFGPKHQNVEGLQVQLELIDAAIENEIDETVAVVKNRVDVLKRQKTALEQRLIALKHDAFDLNDIGLEYSQMRDRTESLQQLYKTVLERSKELDLNTLLDVDDVQVLEPAELPAGPYSPNLPMNLLITLGFGATFGVGLIFMIGALDNTIKSEEDVARFTRTPLLGALPDLDSQAMAGLAGDDNPVDMITHFAPRSAFAEGIKTLRTNLMFMSADRPPTMLLVTSPGPSEGKTLISTNMAIAIAQSGLRTLVVDCDLRRPRLHQALGIDNDLGVSDIVAGQAKLDDVTHSTNVANLWALTAGHIPPNPSELLHTEAFRQLVEQLRGKYDRIIVDSPPVGAVADALILSRSVDGVIVVLKFGQTRRDQFRRAVDQLDAIGAPLLGCVLNDVKRGQGSYGYSYYYRYTYDEHENPDDKKSSKKLAS